MITDKIGDPGVIRTRDLRFRKPLLYPAELRGQALRRRHAYRARGEPESYAVHLVAGQAPEHRRSTELTRPSAIPETAPKRRSLLLIEDADNKVYLRLRGRECAGTPIG